MSFSLKWKLTSNNRSAWKDRIPFILLFEISTSLELFQEKLTKRASRQIEGESLSIEQVDTEKLLAATQHAILGGFRPNTIKDDPRSPVALRIGPSLIKLVMTRQQESIQSPAVLTQALKVGY